MLARAAATVGDLSTARQSLDACADAPRMKTYEPEFELAVAALQAAELRMAEAADHAAWAAGVAADHGQWNVALAGYHDAARYGAARAILIPLREAATHVDGTFAWCLIDHASALAAHDPVALDEVGPPVRGARCAAAGGRGVGRGRAGAYRCRASSAGPGQRGPRGAAAGAVRGCGLALAGRRGAGSAA